MLLRAGAVSIGPWIRNSPRSQSSRRAPASGWSSPGRRNMHSAFADPLGVVLLVDGCGAIAAAATFDRDRRWSGRVGRVERSAALGPRGVAPETVGAPGRLRVALPANRRARIQPAGAAQTRAAARECPGAARCIRR